MPARLLNEAYCPAYHRAAELLGRRWTGTLVRAMLHGVTRFSELATVVPGISDRVLAERLRELVDEGVIERIEDTKARVEYRLTPKGQALAPIVDALSAWANRFERPPERKRSNRGDAS